MNLSNSQRVMKLLGNLSTRPGDIPRYVRNLPFWGHKPIDVNLPWWSFAAIDFMDSYCSGKESVFEYGTGGSTVFFAQRCKDVTSVEDDASWYSVVDSVIASRALGNVELLMRPFDFHKPVGFEQSEYVTSLGGKNFDIIVIDGQDWKATERPVCFKRAEQHVKPGGIIVVDDSWRYPQLRTSSSAKSVRTFESVGPCRVGVTSTDVYQY